jgi:hypothetical protein
VFTYKLKYVPHFDGLVYFVSEYNFFEIMRKKGDKRLTREQVMERATKEELAIVLEVMSETLKEKDPEA